MRAEARAAWWLLAALVLAACDDDPRAEVLVVTREEGGPLDLDELVLRVDALEPGGEALVLEERTDARTRYASGTLSPWSVLVRPSSERHVGSVLYRYRVEGRRGADVYVARQHRLGFVAGTRLTLPMRLAASCAGVACGQGQTCQDAVCRDDFLPSCPLAPAGSGCDEPVIDAGPTPDATPGLDAGDLGPAPDAGDSAVVDAGDS
ncbi:MAG: hypothetical protein IT379_21805, partial [Deltaproteobacteria bacterium]|nr:hypothetical protein [Deltaproteobacteria bacterium]